MKGEGDFHVENIEKTERSHDDICVLLLDSDATGLMNMSEILRKRGFRVVATTRADDLPRIIKNEKIDLVLAEFRLVERNKFELLEKVRTLYEIPVIDAGEYVKYATNFYCMYRGARFYLKNPFTGSYSENLLQFKVWRLEDSLSQIDSNPPEKKNSITHTQSIGYELKRDNLNNKVKTKDLGEYKGDYSHSVDQKKPGLEMQNEFRQTDDEHSKGNKRKERADTEKDYGSDLGDQKKPKLISADNIGIKTLEAILNIEEANNEIKEPTETRKNEEGSEKEKPEPVCLEDILERWSTQPVTDFAACVIYEFEELDFQPLESVEETVVHREMPLSPCESSNKEAIGQLQMQNPLRASDEELMEDGISLADLGGQSSFTGLDFDLQEGQGSTSDLELFDEIYNDLAKELKP